MVVTCTNSKSAAISENLCFRSVKSASPEQSFLDWQAAIESADDAAIPARELYKGDHWVVVRDILEMGRTRELTVWVCSAGYGLIQPHQAIKPYAATFSPGQPDSVCTSINTASAWWERLHAWNPDGGDGPRSLQSAISRHPKDKWLVVLSPPYLTAVKDDLHRGLDSLASPDNLSIISTGMGRLNGLSEALLPTDERFQSLLAGSKISLNVRIARWLLENGIDYGRQSLKSILGSKISELQKPERPIRQAISDLEVIKFIRERMAASKKPAHTPMLRELRNQGLACEQSRFSHLFKQVCSESASGALRGNDSGLGLESTCL